MKDRGTQQTGPPGAPVRVRAGGPPRILVVEDELVMLDLNINMLLEAGYAVDAAMDGAAAWDTLQVKSFDLLITDHVMPKVTGLELIEKVCDAGMALPVIMATGALPKDALARSPRLQPAAILIKPYTLAEFLGTVESVLGKN
jgi:DNA-binding response OmpR family regulator